jgi:hypothetical protein
LHIDADRPAGIIFLFDIGKVGKLGRDEQAIETPKVGLDPLIAANRLDPVHRGDLALVIQPRILLADRIDQDVVIIVDLGCEVSRGPRSHHPADGLGAVDDDDLPPEPGRFIGDRHAGDARADDDEVAVHIGL